MKSQILTESNRINAQKSTGPRTVEGKAKCSQNALKTGIDAETIVIKTEDPAAYDELTAGYYEQFAPATQEARALVDTLISAEWFRRRYVRVETSIWNTQLIEQNEPTLDSAYRWTDERLSRVDRRLNSAIRNYTHVLKQLQALTPKAPNPTKRSQPESSPAATEEVKPNSALFLISGSTPVNQPDQQPDKQEEPSPVAA